MKYKDIKDNEIDTTSIEGITTFINDIFEDIEEIYPAGTIHQCDTKIRAIEITEANIISIINNIARQYRRDVYTQIQNENNKFTIKGE